MVHQELLGLLAVVALRARRVYREQVGLQELVPEEVPLRLPAEVVEEVAEEVVKSNSIDFKAISFHHQSSSCSNLFHELSA
jgi:hypothetical protein